MMPFAFLLTGCIEEGTSTNPPGGTTQPPTTQPPTTQPPGNGGGNNNGGGTVGRLPAPQGVSVTPEGILSWQPVNGANSYAVYVITSRPGGFNFMTVVEGRNNTSLRLFDDYRFFGYGTDLDGQSWHLYVVASPGIYNRNESNPNTSEPSAIVQLAFLQPLLLVPSPQVSGQMLTWNQIAHASGYLIRLQQGERIWFEELGNVTSVSVWDLGIDFDAGDVLYAMRALGGKVTVEGGVTTTWLDSFMSNNQTLQVARQTLANPTNVQINLNTSQITWVQPWAFAHDTEIFVIRPNAIEREFLARVAGSSFTWAEMSEMMQELGEWKFELQHVVRGAQTVFTNGTFTTRVNSNVVALEITSQTQAAPSPQSVSASHSGIMSWSWVGWSNFPRPEFYVEITSPDGSVSSFTVGTTSFNLNDMHETVGEHVIRVYTLAEALNLQLSQGVLTRWVDSAPLVHTVEVIHQQRITDVPRIGGAPFNDRIDFGNPFSARTLELLRPNSTEWEMINANLNASAFFFPGGLEFFNAEGDYVFRTKALAGFSQVLTSGSLTTWTIPQDSEFASLTISVTRQQRLAPVANIGINTLNSHQVDIRWWQTTSDVHQSGWDGVFGGFEMYWKTPSQTTFVPSPFIHGANVQAWPLIDFYNFPEIGEYQLRLRARGGHRTMLFGEELTIWEDSEFSNILFVNSMGQLQEPTNLNLGFNRLWWTNDPVGTGLQHARWYHEIWVQRPQDSEMRLLGTSFQTSDTGNLLPANFFETAGEYNFIVKSRLGQYIRPTIDQTPTDAINIWQWSEFSQVFTHIV